MKKRNERENVQFFIINSIFAILLLISSSATFAAVKGVIEGRVIDEQTGEYLPGANVCLVGTSLGAATDGSGNFVIVNVPEGSYEVKVTYVGYEEFSTNVTISEEVKKVNLLIELKVSYVEMGEVVVEGLRQGQAKALSQQKNAEKIENVVDEEQMKLFPDVNTAEVLQRVPGISIARDQGEGRYVLIRGTSNRMNSTSINGVKVPSPEGGTRSVALDVIAADQLAGIEVTKAITPDMDGDAIGGAVNLKTKSALDYPGKVLSATLGGGYNQLSGKPNYQGGFNFGNRLSKKKNIGLMLSGSVQQTNRATHNNEIDWGDVEDSTEQEIDWTMKTLQLRGYDITRNRMTLSGTVDYFFNQGNKFYVTGLYSRYADTEIRRAMIIDPDNADFYNTATNISGAAFGSDIKDRDQNQKISSFILGGENRLASFKIDYKFSYGYSEEEEPNKIEYAFELNEEPEINLDLSNPDYPLWDIVDLTDNYEYNPDNYEFDELETDTTKTTNRDIGAEINFEMPYNLASYQASLKFGGKTVMKKKDRNERIWEYGWKGDDNILMNQFIDNKDEKFLDGNYKYPLTVNPGAFRRWFEANKDEDTFESELLYDDTYGGSYKAKEDVFAYYGMTRVNFRKIMLIGGFRHEITKIDYKGHEVSFNEDGEYEQTIDRENEATFSHFLPMLHLKYQVTEQSNLRIALTKSIARPDYETLVPYKLIYREDEEMEIGNPDLIPTTSLNFDLLGEYYFQNIGVITGGIFLKSLKDIIYPYVYDMPEDDQNYPDYEVSTWIQGKEASLFGFEIHWQQQLTFLPGILKYLGVYANYTHTSSSATIGERKDVPLAGQSADMANLALSYEKGGFSGRVSMNYHGKYLEELGEDENEDIYYDNHVQWDASISQNLFKGIKLFVQAINLNNAPLRYYVGESKWAQQQEWYSWWVNFGLNFDL